MSKPNLTSDVLDAVFSGVSSPIKITKFVLGNPNSVRSALRRLLEREEIVRRGRGNYQPVLTSPTFLFRHYLADTQYKRGIAVEIYTIEKTDEELNLIEYLAQFLNEGFVLSFGYSREEVENIGQPINQMELIGL